MPRFEVTYTSVHTGRNYATPVTASNADEARKMIAWHPGRTVLSIRLMRA